MEPLGSISAVGVGDLDCKAAGTERPAKGVCDPTCFEQPQGERADEDPAPDHRLAAVYMRAADRRAN